MPMTIEKAKEIVIRVLTGKGGSDSYQDALEVLLRQCDDDYDTAFPIDEWHEDHGPALFWKFPLEDPPQVSSPLYSDFEEQKEFYGWTHFTKIRCPKVIVKANPEGGPTDDDPNPLGMVPSPAEEAEAYRDMERRAEWDKEMREDAFGRRGS